MRLVLLGEFAICSFPWRGIRQFRTHRYQVAGQRFENRRGGLNGDVMPAAFQLGGELLDLSRQQRFAAGDDDMASCIFFNFAENRSDAVRLAFRLP